MNQGANECPDLFKMGDWYYLIYSNYTDGLRTYYRMSRSAKGPWFRPKADTFDGRAFYAGKTGFDGKNRYIYGWNPTKGEKFGFRMYNWKERYLGFFVSDGEFEVRDVVILTEESLN